MIAAVHGACIGAGELVDGTGVSPPPPPPAQGLLPTGVDLISACDIRYCAQDAWFQVKVSGWGPSGGPDTPQVSRWLLGCP